MVFVCPHCKASRAIDEAFIGHEGTVLRCEGCRRFFRVFDEKKKTELPSPGGWMVRKMDGDVVRVDRLAVLHRWIMDGTVTENDQFMMVGTSWRRIGEIYELSGVFDLARLKDREEKRAVKERTEAAPELKGVAARPPAKGARARRRVAEPDKPIKTEPDPSGMIVMPVLLQRSMLVDPDDSKVFSMPLRTVRQTVAELSMVIPLKKLRPVVDDDHDAIPIDLKPKRIRKGKKPRGKGRRKA
jgi:predicted Zn finger-like uncharacterized protein